MSRPVLCSFSTNRLLQKAGFAKSIPFNSTEYWMMAIEIYNHKCLGQKCDSKSQKLIRQNHVTLCPVRAQVFYS